LLWLNAVCNTACACDKVSNRKLRGAVYVQTTQVTGYSGALETRERGIFQVDTVAAIPSYRHTFLKHCCGSGAHCHAVTDAPTDRNALESQVGLGGQNATPVVEKAGISSDEVSSPGEGDSLSRVVLENVQLE
jgi:hypothetical protein